MPYALSLLATTVCWTDGERRIASSTVHVPRTLDSSEEIGLRLATPTWVWAARWNTVCASDSPRTRSIRCWSQMSPRTRVTADHQRSCTGPSAMSSRTTTTTSASRSHSWATT